MGAAAGARDEQGERNSMKDGRRHELAPPKQLLQPGAAARLPSRRARHRERDMREFSTAGVGRGGDREDVTRRPRRRCKTLAHDPAPCGSDFEPSRGRVDCCDGL